MGLSEIASRTIISYTFCLRFIAENTIIKGGAFWNMKAY
jgi:hypothetical protein